MNPTMNKAVHAQRKYRVAERDCSAHGAISAREHKGPVIRGARASLGSAERAKCATQRDREAGRGGERL